MLYALQKIKIYQSCRGFEGDQILAISVPELDPLYLYYTRAFDSQ
jgi:hypothetical protein